MSKEKKKSLIITILLAVIAVILICVFAFIEMRKSGVISSEESREIMEEFYDAYQDDEKEIIYYASSSCGYCEMQKPILELIAEDYDLDYVSIDSSLLSSKQKKEMIEKLNIEGSTPTIVVVENEKVVGTNVGYTDGRELVKFFKDNGVLKEDAVYSAEKYITFINYDEYKSLIRSSDTHIIVVGQTSCSHCISYKPALNSVAEDYDLTINYLNITELSQEESEKFSESLKKIEYNDPDFVEDGSFGTPLTLIVKDGKVRDYISGARTISQLVRELTKIDLIEE